MKLSEIEATLRQIEVRPVKTLGQNFLHDQNLARWIVEHAGVGPGDFVLEIGPGLGALTEFILEKGAKVLALEKDGRLAKFLQEKFGEKSFSVVHGDALDYDPKALLAEKRVICLGNLPYYIATPLLFRFAGYPSYISHALFMLQKEMALRLAAAPGSQDYGALSLMVQLHYRVKFLRTVSPSVFLPQPEVDSGLVELTPRAPGELPACDHGTFARLVRAGFSQRRKQLQKLLREEIPGWEEAAALVGCSATARAEELSLSQWIALAAFRMREAIATEKSRAEERFVVVDENDRVTGAAPRAQVHGDNLRHRAVHILLFRANGDLFLQKRSPWKDRHPGVWDSSAAGHVDAGEEYDEAAARELQEELGIETPLESAGALPASEKTGMEFIRIYRGKSDGPFVLPPSEIELGDFFPPDLVDRWTEARPHEFAPGFLECWKTLRNRDAAPAARKLPGIRTGRRRAAGDPRPAICGGIPRPGEARKPDSSARAASG